MEKTTLRLVHMVDGEPAEIFERAFTDAEATFIRNAFWMIRDDDEGEES